MLSAAGMAYRLQKLDVVTAWPVLKLKRLPRSSDEDILDPSNLCTSSREMTFSRHAKLLIDLAFKLVSPLTSPALRST
jgi:hypothetical protein